MTPHKLILRDWSSVTFVTKGLGSINLFINGPKKIRQIIKVTPKMSLYRSSSDYQGGNSKELCSNSFNDNVQL